ncbi:hypothetical protein TVAG_311300 [Trichomonas vaginalis G3]|uniref:Leucine Rich Repeat family protein n=1 Tax=Trichomonas vaginalis (strain ATCC PRA-98 / G3) TaxID=412133 RepID=A2FX56_TRIV3|nr:ribonuclease inhibitor domain-containing protein [Trichomonas vaginalis G3]EAX90502.1 hypothetical protein TVAG_311300 [Trichomonas vaginalis G3]KAI5553553.1 ribonuclease inhibitor domain-containing protein [Trichomonas vaginalis G3]|eukprot:XP_001303432.1 hypothetical protein [Trichomonas vaginalis G3]
MNTEPLWLQKVKQLLKKSYSLDLSGENITDIKLFPRTTALKHLNLSYTQLKSLQGLKLQKALQTLSIEGSSISSFAGFSVVRSISNITLKRSLVEKIPNYQTSLLIVCPNLHTIDGKVVRSSTKIIAQKLAENPLIPKLVNLGWIATYPIEDEEVEELARQFGILDEHLTATHFQGDHQGDQFEDELRRIDEEHNRIVEEAKKSCGFATTDAEGMEFQEEEFQDETQVEASGSADIQHIDVPNYTLLDRVATILAFAGHQIDPKNLQESVLRIIENLCEQQYQKLSTFADDDAEVQLEEEDFAAEEQINEEDAQEVEEESSEPLQEDELALHEEDEEEEEAKPAAVAEEEEEQKKEDEVPQEEEKIETQEKETKQEEEETKPEENNEQHKEEENPVNEEEEDDDNFDVKQLLEKLGQDVEEEDEEENANDEEGLPAIDEN